VSAMLCPHCGGTTHRSHTRGIKEKLFKSLTSHKTYRCRECGWRGWLRSADDRSFARRNKIRTVISVLITLVVTTLLALYLVDKLGTTPPSAPLNQHSTP
jgi:predicted RNA-binding Zn-ribbon protein involved in translation (DUF1610 family)